jgi:hypothetical protein
MGRLCDVLLHNPAVLRDFDDAVAVAVTPLALLLSTNVVAEAFVEPLGAPILLGDLKPNAVKATRSRDAFEVKEECRADAARLKAGFGVRRP